MCHLLGLILVAAAVLTGQLEAAKGKCYRSELTTKTREYSDGEELITAHKQALKEIPSEHRTSTGFRKVSLEVIQVKRNNRTFTVKRLMGFDGTGKAKLNLEYSIYNAGKTAMLRTLPKGTFDGLLRECEEVKHFKKMFAFYMQPDPLFAPGLLSNPLYMNPLASPVVTYPEYSGLGFDSNWASPIWDDLIPFGAENPNSRNPQAQAFGGMNMMGQPR